MLLNLLPEKRKSVGINGSKSFLALDFDYRFFYEFFFCF